MQNDKKVIMINGNNEQWYEQAIFIVKNQDKISDPINFVSEAEKIINNYMMNSYDSKILKYDEKFLKYEDDYISIEDENENKNIKVITKKKNDFETTVNYVMIMCCLVFLFGLVVILK